jgi:serine beta-lactamase-like protein LACTB
MKNNKFSLLAVLMATLFSTTSIALQQNQLADFALDELKASANLVGLSAASYNQKGEKWSRYVGYADKSAKLTLSAKTEFRYASVSKFVTTGLLAKLVSEGKVDLDESIYTYIPDFPKKQYDFTIRQLVTHTAGIPHYQALHDFNIDYSSTPYTSVQQGVSLFENRSLLHKPGSEYHYSSFAFNLLSLIIENAGKKPFLEQLTDMTSMLDTDSIKAEHFDAPNNNWSKLYNSNGDSLNRNNIGYKWAGGGLIGTAADLAKFGVSLLNDDTISTQTLQQFNIPQTFDNGDEIKVSRSFMGVGWRIKENRFGQQHFHHSGSITGARSHVSVFPKSNESMVLLTNTPWVVALDETAASLQILINAQPEKKCQLTQAHFGNKTSRVNLSFTEKDGMCIADIKLGKKLTNTLAGNTDKTKFSLMMTTDDKVALITPIGIFQGTMNDNKLSLEILAKLHEFIIKDPAS